VRIGFVIPTLYGGGAEFVTRTWITELAKLGHEVTAYTYDARGDTQILPPTVRRRQFPFHGRVRKSVLLPVWLRRRLRKDDVEIVICMMTFTNLIGLAALTVGRRPDTALVISERNMPSVLLPRFGLSGRVQLWLARLLYRRADAAIAISHPVAGDLVGGLRTRPDRTFVVPNPVVERASENASPLPARLTLGFVGRLLPQKQPELFVQVLENLLKRGVQVEGIVIGDGPSRHLVEDLSRRGAVRVQFLGWVDPWSSLAGGMDCLLLPSMIEGFGNVLVEAAAARLPCVASSRAMGVADALVPGLTGELAVDDSPVELADAVLRAVAQSGRDPVEQWLSRYSTDQSVSVLLRVLQKVSSKDAS
jgi:glycosyltransferase involved in cell wall biosynthesis